MSISGVVKYYLVVAEINVGEMVLLNVSAPKKCISVVLTLPVIVMVQ